MFNVYQHWDPLKVCIVGRSYPPEFFSWIKNSRARAAMEKVATESEEDFQLIIKTLDRFGVKVLRPNLPTRNFNIGQYIVPPVVPRDHMGMIGNTFYESNSYNFAKFYNSIKATNWPPCNSIEELASLPKHIQDECYNIHNLDIWLELHDSYNEIFNEIKSQGNIIRSHIRSDLEICNTAQMRPMGKDLIVGTWSKDSRPGWKHFTKKNQQEFLDNEFTNTKNHIFDTQGHADSSFCPIMPGLILSVDNLDFSSVFPDWEVHYFPQWVKHRTTSPSELHRSWFIPEFENNPDVIDVVENHLKSWTGNSAETVFDIGVLHIDEKNILSFGTHEPTLNLLERRGITVHQIPFRHRWFWDGGIHCVTCDLHREGTPRKILP